MAHIASNLPDLNTTNCCGCGSMRALCQKYQLLRRMYRVLNSI